MGFGADKASFPTSPAPRHSFTDSPDQHTTWYAHRRLWC